MTGNQIYDIDSAIVENKIDFFDSTDVKIRKRFSTSVEKIGRTQAEAQTHRPL